MNVSNFASKNFELIFSIPAGIKNLIKFVQVSLRRNIKIVKSYKDTEQGNLSIDRFVFEIP